MPNPNLNTEVSDSTSNVGSGSDLDDEMPDLQNFLSQFPANANLHEMTEALKEFQLENIALKSKLKKYRMDEAARDVEMRAGKKRAGTNNIPDALIPHKDMIAKLGRKYCITICPWLEYSPHGRKGRPDADPNSDSRYKTPASREDCAVAELYDHVPKELHKLMENHTKFTSIFRLHLNNQRSNALSSIRQKAGLIFGFMQDYFESPYPRANLPEFQNLLKHNDKYTIYAPVLFEGRTYDSTRRTFFLSDLIPRVIRTMIFGRSTEAKSRPQTLAERWGLKEATPGLIAFASIVTRYLLSPDTEMRQIGKISGINWEEDFYMYKRALSTKTPRIQAVFDRVNQSVFNIKPAPKSTPTALVEDGDNIEDFIRELNDDDGNDNVDNDYPDLDEQPSSPLNRSRSTSPLNNGPSRPASPPRMMSPPQDAPQSVAAARVDVPLASIIPPSLPTLPESATASRRLSTPTATAVVTGSGTTPRRSSSVHPSATVSGTSSRRSSGLLPSALSPPPDVPDEEVPETAATQVNTDPLKKTKKKGVTMPRRLMNSRAQSRQ